MVEFEVNDALDINSVLEINKRLLKGFSVNALKEIFNLGDINKRQPELLSIAVNSNTVDVINKMVFDHFSLLKQSVFLYESKGVLNDNWLDAHPSFINKLKVSNQHTIFNLLFPVKFEGFNKTKGVSAEFDFLVPVQIHKSGTVLIIHINLLERDISAITEDKIVGATRDIKDENILNSIFPYANPVILTKCDLNKGIKQLWHDDEIDALNIKYKRAKSTSHEIMDEDNLIKKEMPEVYEALIKTPLRQATFKILKKDNLVNFFKVDPSIGTFHFSVFPKHLNATNDLIDLVLINN